MVYTKYQESLILKYKDFKFPEYRSMDEMEEYINSIFDVSAASLENFYHAKLYYATQFNAFNYHKSLVRPITKTSNIRVLVKMIF